ncbi:uncharacterized protein Bfra_004569 [Botrytis fragariae]|uniref:Uncharacterized protein n=1 Tax=Botrytis fragariae TaxID=1964551 RepID=A0A8H6AVZ5_9HELO|nr:uncharacterized protein Bfra_004569 [Botrytis fragariae]KAF5874558.1 hypothetical protein Bfra_004569 [Botrytis fragariae]
MCRPRHHIDYSDNEEIQIPVPKLVPIIWSDEDKRALAETSLYEIRLWRNGKELYGIYVTDHIPPSTTASFVSERGTNNVPVWAETACQRFIKMLKSPVFKGNSGLNLRRSNGRVREFLKTQNLQPPEVPTDLPKHSEFTKNIKNCAEENETEPSVALGISALDFETIMNSWDVYVSEHPEHGLETIARYSARRTERVPVIDDDGQSPDEPNNLRSLQMTSDDESPMQSQEDSRGGT